MAGLKLTISVSLLPDSGHGASDRIADAGTNDRLDDICTSAKKHHCLVVSIRFFVYAVSGSSFIDPFVPCGVAQLFSSSFFVGYIRIKPTVSYYRVKRSSSIKRGQCYNMSSSERVSSALSNPFTHVVLSDLTSCTSLFWHPKLYCTIEGIDQCHSLCYQGRTSGANHV